MPILALLGPVGLGGLLATQPASASPPVDPEGPAVDGAPASRRFEPRPTDPRAADYTPREPLLTLDFVYPSLRVTNHLVRTFAPGRPHAYGLDVMAGARLYFEGKRVGMALEPATGYAFVHRAESDRHAWITGARVCLLPLIDDIFGLCYTPNFVLGPGSGGLARGFRHGLALEFFRFAIEAQHGVVWFGPHGPRHEIRGALSIDLAAAIGSLVVIVGLMRM